jgi:hypothetical protein
MDDTRYFLPLSVERPPGEDFFLVWLRFEAPQSDPIWCPCQCFSGPWDEVRAGLAEFLETSDVSPDRKTAVSIHQGDEALAAIRTLAHYSNLRSQMLAAQPLN